MDFPYQLVHFFLSLPCVCLNQGPDQAQPLGSVGLASLSALQAPSHSFSPLGEDVLCASPGPLLQSPPHLPAAARLSRPVLPGCWLLGLETGSDAGRGAWGPREADTPACRPGGSGRPSPGSADLLSPVPLPLTVAASTCTSGGRADAVRPLKAPCEWQLFRIRASALCCV